MLRRRLYPRSPASSSGRPNGPAAAARPWRRTGAAGGAASTTSPPTGCAPSHGTTGFTA